jgi:hypothetical protein
VVAVITAREIIEGCMELAKDHGCSRFKCVLDPGRYQALVTDLITSTMFGTRQALTATPLVLQTPFGPCEVVQGTRMIGSDLAHIDGLPKNSGNQRRHYVFDLLHAQHVKLAASAAAAPVKAPCQRCSGEGWVCEDHPNIAWKGGTGCPCGAAGAGCGCEPLVAPTAPRCECGSDAVGSPGHSTWCPKGRV